VKKYVGLLLLLLIGTLFATAFFGDIKQANKIISKKDQYIACMNGCKTSCHSCRFIWNGK